MCFVLACRHFHMSWAKVDVSISINLHGAQRHMTLKHITHSEISLATTSICRMKHFFSILKFGRAIHAYKWQSSLDREITQHVRAKSTREIKEILPLHLNYPIFFSRFRLIFIKLWLYLWPLMNITPFRCISLPKLLQTIAVEMLCRLNQLTKKTHAAVLHVWPRKWNVSSLQLFVNKTDLNDVCSSIIYIFHVKSTNNYYTHQSYGFTDVRFQTNTHHYKMLCYELLSGGHNFVQNMNDFVNRRGYNHRRGGWTFLRNYK